MEDIDSDSDSDSEDFHSGLHGIRRGLMEFETLESDYELAYRLQMQEALNASVAFQPSDQDPIIAAREAGREREINHGRHREMEMPSGGEGFSRRIYDQSVIAENGGMKLGGSSRNLFGEGSSTKSNCKVANFANEERVLYRLYFKGLVSEEISRGKRVAVAGIGVAICDPKDNLIFELKKPLVVNGISKIAAEAMALIEGLNAAASLSLKRLTFYCHYYPLFQFVRGRWTPKQHKTMVLVNQVILLQRSFTQCYPRHVTVYDVKYVFKFARDAITSQITVPEESSNKKNMKESCVICLEDNDATNMFSIDGCHHWYCSSCMKQHVEVKLRQGMIPKCPHEGCKSELRVDSCRIFLTQKLIETMQLRIKEASIPASEKIYCPYPRCSALMSKNEVLEYAKDMLGDFFGQSGPKKCLKCHGLFCLNCKVAWHSGLTCNDYKRLNPYPPAEDVKLKSLAASSLWRQCVKCNHMIELAEGCFHMTCRCGYEFCYNCGAEYKNKEATCSCPRWEERNILFGDDWDLDEEEDDEEDDYNDEEEEEEWEDEFSDSDVSHAYFPF